MSSFLIIQGTLLTRWEGYAGANNFALDHAPDTEVFK
jgi:hypothetical protein